MRYILIREDNPPLCASRSGQCLNPDETLILQSLAIDDVKSMKIVLRGFRWVIPQIMGY